MNYKEFRENISQLDLATAELENLFIENGGEFTEEAEQKEAHIKAITDVLANDGIDFLGRWLKSSEDKKATLNNEKEYVNRCIKALDNKIAYIKGIIYLALERLGETKKKGTLGYSFSTYTSTSTTTDKETLKTLYQEKIEKAAREIGIPSDVTITLGASSSKLDEGVELPAYYCRTESPAVKFLKPKVVKEDDIIL